MKMISKILATILWVGILLIGMRLAGLFIHGITILDDEIIFITALTLGVIVDTIVLMLIFSIFMVGIWEKKKNGNKKK